MTDLNWQWDGVWSTSGNGNWTCTMSELEKFDRNGFLPGTDLLWAEQNFRKFWDTCLEDHCGWEFRVNGSKFVIFND